MSDDLSILPISAVHAIVERERRIKRLHDLLDSNPTVSGPFLAQLDTPEDQHLVNSVYSLTNLRRIHLDMVQKIDGIIYEHTDLLITRKADKFLDQTYPPLSPTPLPPIVETTEPTLPLKTEITETPSPPQFFSPISEYVPSASPIALPRRNPRKKRNPYPKTILKKPVIDLSTDSDHPIERPPSPTPTTTSSDHSPRTKGMDAISPKTGQMEDTGPGGVWRKLSKTKARKHRSNGCQRIGHDEYDCRYTTCNICFAHGPGHDPLHCPSNPNRPSTSTRQATPKSYRARNPQKVSFSKDDTPVGEYSCNWPMGRPPSPPDVEEEDYYYNAFDDGNRSC